MVELTLRNASNIGGEISDDNFGVNFLFNRDRIDAEGTFDDVIRNMGVQTIRYPGGTMAEFAFDMENPDAQIHDWSGTGLFRPIVRAEGHMGLTDFLSYASRDGLDMTFVMPTIRFVGDRRDGNGNRYEAVDVDLVREFTQRLLTDANNKGVPLQAIEIGNEYWADDKISDTGEFELTETEYGRIASRMSAIVQDEINKFKSSADLQGNWIEPEIVVQIGHTDAKTQEIFAQFDEDAEQRAVDATLLHKYEFGSIENIARDVDRHLDQFEEWDRLVRESGDGDFDSDPFRYVTEWNIFETNENHNGLLQASAILQAFANQVEYSVDHGNFWAVQRDNDTDLSGNEGQSRLKASGEMFKLMTESLPGKRMVDIESGRSDVKYHAFRDADQVVLFVSSRADGPLDVTLDVDRLVGSYTNVSGKQLGVIPGEDVRNPNARAEVETLVRSDIEDNGELRLDLDPYEVARLTFARDDGGSGNAQSTLSEEAITAVPEGDANAKGILSASASAFTNNGGDVHDWQFAFEAPFDIISVRDDHLIHDHDNRYAIQQVPSNDDVRAGETMNFDFSATHEGGAIPTPTDARFTGKAVEIEEPLNAGGSDPAPRQLMTAAEPASNLVAELVVQRDWGDRARVDLLITKASDILVEDWELAFTIEEQILDNWNGVFTSQGGGRFRAEDIGWNGSIDPGETINSIGFITGDGDLDEAALNRAAEFDFLI